MKTLNLRCACCGGSAPAAKQYFNQDRGYGLCVDCAEWIASKDQSYGYGTVAEYIEFTYGKKGMHWGVAP